MREIEGPAIGLGIVWSNSGSMKQVIVKAR